MKGEYIAMFPYNYINSLEVFHNKSMVQFTEKIVICSSREFMLCLRNKLPALSKYQNNKLDSDCISQQHSASAGSSKEPKV